MRRSIPVRLGEIVHEHRIRRRGRSPFVLDLLHDDRRNQYQAQRGEQSGGPFHSFAHGQAHHDLFGADSMPAADQIAESGYS
jgi:hypothetical protein